MKLQKTLVYKLPIYMTKIIIVYFTDYRYANRQLEKHSFTVRLTDGDQGYGGYEDVTNPDGSTGRAYFIIIKHEDNSEELKNTIVHETFHVTQDILESAGIPFKKKGMNEPYTYLNSWLQGIVEKFINYK